VKKRCGGGWAEKSSSIDVVEATSPKTTSITKNAPNYISYIVSRVTSFAIDEGDDSCVITFKLHIVESHFREKGSSQIFFQNFPQLLHFNHWLTFLHFFLMKILSLAFDPMV
jgi:hypothetical protein